MGNVINYIKSGLIVGFSYLGYFLGGFDTLMVTLLLFMLVDYISGVINAIIKKEISSRVGAEGIGKKIYIILLVGCVNLLGNAIGIDELRYLVITFYLANEGISIIENASELGLPIPEKIKEVLIQLKSKGSDSDGKSSNNF